MTFDSNSRLETLQKRHADLDRSIAFTSMADGERKQRKLEKLRIKDEIARLSKDILESEKHQN